MGFLTDFQCVRSFDVPSSSPPTDPYSVHVMPPQRECQEILAHLLQLNETEENAPNTRFRAVFPYGVFDEEGLREFLSMHETKTTAFAVHNEIEWFAKAESRVNLLVPRVNGRPSQLQTICDVDISVLKSKLWSQQSSDVVVGDLTAQQLSTLVCNRWISEDVIHHVFSLINQKCPNSDQVYCAVWSPLQKVTGGLQVLENAIKSKHIRLACFAVNVRFDQDTGVTFMANNLLSGNHWALVIIDLQLKALWYGESLGYPLPLNIDAEMESVLELLSRCSGKNMSLSRQCFHARNFQLKGSHICCHSCRPFPLQTCSTVCGLVPITVASLIASNDLTIWDAMTGNAQNRVHLQSMCQVLMKPSEYANRIRLAVASWIVTDNIYMSQLVDLNLLKNHLTNRKPSLRILQKRNVEWSLISSPSKKV